MIVAFEQASTFQHSQGTARTPGSGQEPPGLIADQRMDHLSCAYSSVSRSSHNRPSRSMETCLDGSGFLLREKGDPRVISDLSLHDSLDHCFNHRAVSWGMTLKASA